MNVSGLSILCLLVCIPCSLSQIQRPYDYSPDTEVPHETTCTVRYRNLPSSSPGNRDQNSNNVANVIASSPPTVKNSELDQRCECVPYYQCTNNRTVLQSDEVRSAFLAGVGLVSTAPYSPCPCASATSNSKPSGGGVCGKYLDVCCSSPEVSADEPLLPPLTECGQRGQSEDEGIPWVVAIFGERIINGRRKRPAYLCGGSLIHLNVVLTAAHCVRGKSGLMVRAGGWFIHSSHPTQETSVHHTVIHEEYYAGALYNDIALLFLESPVDLAPNVATVCLPEQGEIMDNRTCVASGWGKRVFESYEKYDGKLKEIELPIVPREICEEAFRMTRLSQRFHLHESFLCAGGQGRDTCEGDGGSPLMCPSANNPDVYVQAGIVSWGIGCGGDTPSAYVNVAYFRTWIDNETAILSVDHRS